MPADLGHENQFAAFTMIKLKTPHRAGFAKVVQIQQGCGRAEARGRDPHFGFRQRQSARQKRPAFAVAEGHVLHFDQSGLHGIHCCAALGSRALR